MKKTLIILTALAFIAGSCKQATKQTAETTSAEEKQNASDIDALLTDVRTLQGAFSVQIMASDDINEVRSEQIKAKSAIKQSVIIVLVQGMYKLYVGDFNTKAEANAVLPEVKKAGYPNAWIVSVNTLTAQEKSKALEEIIIKVIKANSDEDELNSLLIKDFGIAYYYAPGIMSYIYMFDKISYKDRDKYGPPYGLGCETDNYKIRFEELPDYDGCPDDGGKWNKPPGIYCDTTITSGELASTAKQTNELMDEMVWSAKQIKKFKEIEKESHEVNVISKDGYACIFYVTFWQNKWYLMAIAQFDPCSA